MLVTNEIQKLKNTNSQKEKLEILKNISPETKKFLEICYNPRINFYIKKIPQYERISNKFSLDYCINFILENISSRKITGNKAISELRNLLVNSKEPQMVEALIKRNCGANINVSLLNKAFGENFIPEIPCMLAQPYNEKTIKAIKFPALAQEKADGMRCIIIKDKNGINFYSRNGSKLELNHIKEILDDSKLNDIPEFILDGEIIGIEDSKILERQVSNGLCNKLIRNTIKDTELLLLGLQVWDLITDKNIKYINRFNTLKEIIHELNNSYIQIIDSVEVKSLDEAKEVFKEKLNSGFEGIILKNKDNLWENKRTKDLVKFKDELTIDLEVIDVIEGDGEFKGGLGALVAKTKCNKLKVNIGTGFSLNERGLEYDLTQGKEVKIIKDFNLIKEKFMNKIIEVKYNSIIKDKDNNYSLFLPRFIKLRDDKDEANTIDEI